MSTSYHEKSTAKLQDQPGIRHRVSSMIEYSKRQSYFVDIHQRQLNDKKIAENYSYLIKLKIHQGLSQEVEFKDKNFECLHKVLKIYQQTLASKQQNYKTQLQKHLQIKKFNQQLASENTKNRVKVQNLIAEQSRIKSMINQQRMKKQNIYKFCDQKEVSSENSDDFGPTYSCQKINQVSMQQFIPSFQKRPAINQKDVQLIDLRNVRLQTIESLTDEASNISKINQEAEFYQPFLENKQSQSFFDSQNGLLNIGRSLKSKIPANHKLLNTSYSKKSSFEVGNPQDCKMPSAQILPNVQSLQIQAPVSQMQKRVNFLVHDIKKVNKNIEMYLKKYENK